MQKMTIDTDRGYASLLSVILEVENDDFWLRWGLVPPGRKPCVVCGKPIGKYGEKGGQTGIYCLECWEKMHHVTLRCAQCGKEFRLNMSAYRIRMKKRRVFSFFCSRKCWGKYVAANYGFKKKYDYAVVQELWTRTKWTVTKIAEHLGIPRGAASKALQGLQEYRQYRSARRKYD